LQRRRSVFALRVDEHPSPMQDTKVIEGRLDCILGANHTIDERQSG
jgi:hypothetical protein